MYNRKSIVQRLWNRQVGLGNPRLSVSQYGLLENVQNLRPIYELRHCAGVLASDPQWRGSTTNKNHVSSIRFNRKGNLVGSSYWCNDKIELWDWIVPEDERDLSVETGHGCSVARFDWLPLDAERLILTVDKYGHLRLLDLGAEVSCALLDGRATGLAYDLHARLPYSITVGDAAGVVRNVDLRAGSETADVLLQAKQENGSVYDIEWLGINPQRYHEFCVAGSADDLRIYDRRNPALPCQKLFMTVPPHARTNKHSGDLYDPSNALLFAGRTSPLDLAFNYNGTKLAVSCALDSVFLYDTSMSYPIGRYETAISGCVGSACSRASMIRSVEFFGPRSEFLVATARTRERRGGASGKAVGGLGAARSTNIFVWDSDLQKLVRRIPIKERSWAIAVHPHVPIIATSLDHRGVQLWG